MRKITIEELILELSPFSKELVNWCISHKEFLKALKVTNPKRFVAAGAVITSYPFNHGGDEVIGLPVFDYKINNPIFKQDFIVNKGNKNQEFILYTRNPEGSSRYVKDISEFYKIYGQNGAYRNTHHLTIDQLPIEMQLRAFEVMKLAEQLENILVHPKQGEISRIYREVKKIKKGVWMQKVKLSKFEEN